MAVLGSVQSKYIIVMLLVAIQFWPTIEIEDEPLTYFIEEELEVGSFIANIVTDSGLNLKYEPGVLHKLRYSYLTKSENMELFNLGERTGHLSTSAT